MARKTVALLPSTERALEKVGANIKRARLRRNIRAELLVNRNFLRFFFLHFQAN